MIVRHGQNFRLIVTIELIDLLSILTYSNICGCGASATTVAASLTASLLLYYKHANSRIHVIATDSCNYFPNCTPIHVIIPVCIWHYDTFIGGEICVGVDTGGGGEGIMGGQRSLPSFYFNCVYIWNLKIIVARLQKEQKKIPKLPREYSPAQPWCLSPPPPPQVLRSILCGSLHLYRIIIMRTSTCTCIIQYSEANDYSEQKRKAVESLDNKVSHNQTIPKPDKIINT
jgi:hypothetical protein